MYDPHSTLTGKVLAVSQLIHQSHLVVNSTKMTLKKLCQNCNADQTKKLQSSCHALMSPFIAWFQKNHPGKEFDRLIKQ